MAFNGMVVDLTDDSPVDLSSHQNSALSSQPSDAACLVDSPGKENVYGSLSTEETVKLLRDELRNEETKLVLLRKIRLSQSNSKLKTTATVSPTVRTNGHAPTVLASPQRHGTQRTPGAQSSVDTRTQSPGGQVQQMQLPSRSIIKSPQYSSAQRSSRVGPSTTSQAPTQQTTARGQVEAVQQQRAANVAAVAALQQQEQLQKQLAQQQQQKQLMIQKAAAEAQKQQQAAVAQQRQANAKQALRKQLEQTLLQIPPPKPPPPTVTLIPNANSGEFLMLIGLEECVRLADRTKKTKSTAEIEPEKVPAEENSRASADSAMNEAEDAKTEGKRGKPESIVMPTECRQCGTDHTPVWVETNESSVGGSKRMVCERCDSSNRKQALKLEHTNRLKSAFVKALQQEQAIDQGLIPGVATTTADIRVGSATRISGSSGSQANVSVSRGGAMGAEELARRMIAHRNSNIQYRSSPNQATRPSNGQGDRQPSHTSRSSASPYDRPVSNHLPRNSSSSGLQFDRSPANHMPRSSAVQYERPSSSQTARVSASHHERLSQARYDSQSAQRAYKILPSDDGRYGSPSNRGSPYSRN